ncbi:MAG: CopG family transcriptional regulator [Magnetococcales bacterium]|nr:CopG family transcriptional regulator [Magnetococcales bacterium]
MSMPTLIMDHEVESHLRKIAEALDKPVDECLRDAVMQYVEDRQDYLIAARALAREEPSITLDELEQRLGLGR